MKNDFDESWRSAVARGWASTPMSQGEYAAQHGISPRTLREWVKRYGGGERPVARALAIIDTALAQLQDLRAGLVAEEACRDGVEALNAEVQGEAERHAELEAPHTVLDDLAAAEVSGRDDGPVAAERQAGERGADVPPSRRSTRRTPSFFQSF